MNREDRTKFLALIETKNPALLVGVDREHVGDDQIMALVDAAMTPPPPPAASEASANGAGLSAAHLGALCTANNLTYHFGERVEDMRDGVPRRVWRQRTRPLEAGDILAHRLLPGGWVRFTTKDGRRYELQTVPV